VHDLATLSHRNISPKSLDINSIPPFDNLIDVSWFKIFEDDSVHHNLHWPTEWNFCCRRTYFLIFRPWVMLNLHTPIFFHPTHVSGKQLSTASKSSINKINASIWKFPARGVVQGFKLSLSNFILIVQHQNIIISSHLILGIPWFLRANKTFIYFSYHKIHVFWNLQFFSPPDGPMALTSTGDAHLALFKFWPSLLCDGILIDDPNKL